MPYATDDTLWMMPLLGIKTAVYGHRNLEVDIFSLSDVDL
jgi:hypothetical protein